jgi:integrase
MRGIARKDRREPAKAHPLSITDLTAICNELFRLYMNKSSCEYWRLTRDIALITIGWCGALRASELVALNWNDIVEVQQGIEITVRQSKTSLDAEIIALPLLRDDYRFICPVRAMRLWKRSCMDINLSIPGIDIHTRTGIPADGAQPVFVNCFGKRLNKRSVSRILESASAKSNLNLHLSAHSLRRGFATFAAFAGITDRSLMRHGRWKTSSIMQGYIEHAKIWTDNPVVQLLT